MTVSDLQNKFFLFVTNLMNFYLAQFGYESTNAIAKKNYQPDTTLSAPKKIEPNFKLINDIVSLYDEVKR